MSRTTNQETKHGKWSESEDEALRMAINEYGEKQWRHISERVQGRSPIQCLHRWSKILKPGLKKGSWSAHEDLLLKKWVEQEGAEKWSLCAKVIDGRSGKQCRERWFNILNPNVKKGDWTPEEDSLIFKMVNEIGKQWTLIAASLDGRTENSVKNRYYSNIRKISGHGVNGENDTKIELEIDKLPEMSSLISQIQQFEVLLGSKINEIKQLESLLEAKNDDTDELKIFQNGIHSITEEYFK